MSGSATRLLLAFTLAAGVGCSGGRPPYIPRNRELRHEIHADSLPLVIAGHSLGAEVAIWTAAFAKPPGTVGVIAMSPGLRSHLRVAMSDLLNNSEPEEAGSFSVALTLHEIAPEVRVAIVRAAVGR